jgi:DNA polymerase V
MGFPSPASDYVEDRISLDALCITHPSATYFMKAGNHAPRIGLVKGSLLVIDCSLTPVHGSIIVSGQGEELMLKRYLTYPVPALQDLNNPSKVTVITDNEDDKYCYGGARRTVWGVVTYWITPADMYAARDDV